MADREQVIKGFECCHVMVHNLGPDKSSCGICPYKDVQTEEQIDLGGIECIAVLHDDALALLKEQEAVVRCRDCKHGEKVNSVYLCGKIRGFGIAHDGNWFCADGEKDGDAGMSVKNGVWHNAALELPPDHVDVLIVKQLKSGQRNIGIGYCIPEYKHHNYETGEDVIEPYWVCGGNNNVVYWMPLPKIPEA